MGAVHLTVGDLARSVRFYEAAIGMSTLDAGGDRAALGVGGVPLIHLVEVAGAEPAPGTTGLFHLALRVPERADLATWLVHAARDEIAIAGASDHFVSEAIYLQDPDEHGIEIYADRPREVWDGRVAEMDTDPLNVGGLLLELEDPEGTPFDGLPDGTDMGHVHLRVSQIEPTTAFYRDVLGFELMLEFGPQALFFGAGGYHHHVGANNWMSPGCPPPPPGAAALRHAEVLLPDAAELDRVAGRASDAGVETRPVEGGVLVRDPSGNGLVLAVA
jgi:catechol 2,3-dioxygenase